MLARLLDPARLFGGFNSDSAIPLLMANDDALRVESLYYWGQDRFSGFPFLAASLVHRALGLFWTPEILAVVQALWVAGSIAVMAAWARRAGVVALYACALVAGAWPGTLFDLCQPYAWQLTWLMLALFALSRQVETRARWAPLALFAFTLQAQWANSMSGLWVLGLVLAELVFARGHRRALALGALLPVVLALAGEGALRGIVQLRYRNVHGMSVVTAVRVQLDDLPKHFAMMFSRIDTWWLAVSLLSAVGIAGLWAVKRSLPRWLAYPAVCVVGNLLLPPLVQHIQENGVQAKYFTLAAVLAPFVASAALTLLHPYAVVLPLVGLVWAGPWRTFAPDPEWEPTLSLARSLATARPGAALSSGYWDTYRLAALVPGLRGVPRAGQAQRTPHLYAGLNEVWVGDQGSDGAGDLGFQPHVMVGASVLVPAGETFGRFRLYRAVNAALTGGRACPGEPLVIEGSGRELVVFSTRAVETDRAATATEGPALVWTLAGEPARIVVTSRTACARVSAFFIP